MANYKEICGIVPPKKDGEKGWWTRIGVAFENKDGSYNLIFDYLPTSKETTIQLRDPKPRDGAPAARTHNDDDTF